ncbi:unnamed protein product [Albugo candida]|uniref:Uncharacterized protein n=1 Tax=Albugo candida TaxID=65357 RepID=A0A024G0X2_9STRA|nr:unnamed protein product [Albugo candida]|eukprot:CCI40384.1 unnamed protein product [Albugo candida]
MKRVGGGYVLRPQPTEASTPPQTSRRPTRQPVTPPTPSQISPRRHEAATNVTRVGSTNAPRLTSTQRVASTPRATPTATRINRPAMRADAVARPAAVPETRVTSATRTPVMPATPSEAQPRLREVTQLKKQNVQLSRSLEVKTNQLESAKEQIGLLEADAQELKKQLEVSRKSNAICQRKLDHALKTHREDGYNLNELLEGHTILKQELARSKATLEEFKVLMEHQQKQIIELKREGDLKTSELTDEQTDRISTELLYQKQHQCDESKMKQLEQANLKLKAEVVESRAMLEDFKAFMENELNHLGSIKTDIDERMMRSMEYEEDGYTNCAQGEAVHVHQVHSENDLIPSLKMHIHMVELKLKNSEYNNHILQMQLDRMQN